MCVFERMRERKERYSVESSFCLLEIGLICHEYEDCLKDPVSVVFQAKHREGASQGTDVFDMCL